MVTALSNPVPGTAQAKQMSDRPYLYLSKTSILKSSSTLKY